MNEGDASLFDWEYLCHRCLIGSTFAFVGKGIAASVINGVEFGARIRDRFGYCFVVEQLKEATVKL